METAASLVEQFLPELMGALEEECGENLDMAELMRHIDGECLQVRPHIKSVDIHQLILSQKLHDSPMQCSVPLTKLAPRPRPIRCVQHQSWNAHFPAP